MSTPVISLQGVGKRYVKYEDQPMLVTALLRWRQRSKQSDLWAIRDVDLTINEGESVGILGRNGAGKSTMLQMLAGVTAPSVGVAKVDGRVSPLISVGVGFHPELTGRENVYVNGAILGMARRDIEKRFDHIVEFAELGDFIDTPVKFYSSGMFVRLGFSVAIVADPDIQLVDEVLAVGDFAFQLRCYERMQEILANGTTVVVVSHNLNALRGFCERGVVVDRGRIVHDGSMFDAIGHYHSLMAIKEETADSAGTDATHEQGAAEIVDARLLAESGAVAAHVEPGQPVRFELTVRALRDIERPFTGIVIGSPDRNICVYSDSNVRSPHPPLSAGEVVTYAAEFVAAFPTGSYSASMSVLRHGENHRRLQLAESPAVPFYASGRPLVGGLTDLHATFSRGAPVSPDAAPTSPAP